MPSTAYLIRPRYFSLLLVASLAINILALALPLMTMQVYDRVLSSRSEDTLLVLALGVTLAALLEFILRCCRSMAVGVNAANFEHHATTAALQRALNSEPRDTNNASAATIVQDISGTARMRDQYGGQMVVTLCIDAPFILIFLALQAYIAGWLALVPCVVLAIFVAVSWHRGNNLRELMNQRDAQDDERYSFITRSLGVIHNIKAQCLESPMSRRFEEVQRESGRLNHRIACAYGQAGSLSYGFAQGMTVAVICAGVPMAISGQITVGSLIACVLLSGQVMQPLQRALAMWIRFQDIYLAGRRFDKIFSLPQRDELSFEQLGTNHGELELKNISFAFDPSHIVASGINLKIAPGDAVAIGGVSGSGKTALAELIAGIYRPDSGQVLISGMEASRIPCSERPHYIAHLPMNGLILRGSIMDNLTGFDPKLRVQARHVADQLGIESAVALLPSGYDTPLEGNHADVISPGLKQRISVARALLHKPRLVIFENADHGMDHESYAQIFELIAKMKGRTTLVIVSEDMNILSLADSIYELHNGVLSQVAEPSALVADMAAVQEVAS